MKTSKTVVVVLFLFAAAMVSVAVRAEPLFISAPADGSHERIVTDTAWKASYVGKVVKADIFYGETYDNRAGESFLMEPAAFSDWPNAVVCDEFHGEVTPVVGPGVCRRGDMAIRHLHASARAMPGIVIELKAAYPSVCLRLIDCQERY